MGRRTKSTTVTAGNHTTKHHGAQKKFLGANYGRLKRGVRDGSDLEGALTETGGCGPAEAWGPLWLAPCGGTCM